MMNSLALLPKLAHTLVHTMSYKPYTIVTNMFHKLSEKILEELKLSPSSTHNASQHTSHEHMSYKQCNHHIPHQILEGTTWHTRHTPSKHSFQYPYRYWGLNLNQLTEQPLLTVPAIFAENMPALHRFCYTDYFDISRLDNTNSDNAEHLQKAHASTTTKKAQTTASNNAHTNRTTAQAWLTAVNNEWQRLTDSQPTGEVLALVVSRNLGFYFSPVNFYIGFDDTGTASHLLAEVSNTPWNKSHYYGFRLDDYQHGTSMSFSHKKSFHVSPFNPLDQVYEWRFRLDSNDKKHMDSKHMDSKNMNAGMSKETLIKHLQIERLQISIHVHDARGKVFAAGIHMNATPLTLASIGSSIRHNPIMSHSSMARIYWHAMQLYVVKKIPYISYNQALKDSKQAEKPNNSSDSNNHSNTLSDVHQHSNTIYRKCKGHTTMSEVKKLPTNRTFASPANNMLKKITAYPILSPVSKGIDNACKAIFHKILEQFHYGSITLIETYGTQLQPQYFNNSSADSTCTDNQDKKTMHGDASHQQMGEVVGNHPLHISVTIHDPSFYQKIITGGSIAVADSYINGEWEVDDLTALIRLGSRNKQAMNPIETKLSKVTKMLEFGKHKLRSNTINNAKSNILAHYDLGNEMYKTFLDDTMMYSSGIYPTPHTPLADAQQLKLRELCEQLELTVSDRVIEIGTGWGGFAIYAATHYGCHVTTTTISDAQYDEAKQRVEQAGLSESITLLRQDYRELSGQYDKLISIEMVEAVGHEYLPTFFGTCNELLKPDGIMVLQAITFNDQGYDTYLNSVDFIQSHIFPGGCLLSNQEIINQFTNETDMVVKSLIDYGYDYAHTLRDWRHAFMNRLDDIKAMGYDDTFIRLWQFYFAFCEGGFLEKTIGVVQVKAIKPAHR